jgi:4-azaleucine resistance transporter AzlC
MIATANAIRREMRRGFVTVLPLYAGVLPFSISFAILARSTGFSVLETAMMSVLVFAGSAQLAIVNLTGEHAGTVAILLTVLLLNLRHVLYGISLNTFFPTHVTPPRPMLAAMLTDESYGLTVRDQRDRGTSPAFLFGVSGGLFAAFAVGTVAGAMIGSHFPDPEKLGLDFVFPLSFLALLLPLLRHRIDLTVATIAAVSALILSRIFDGGLVTLIATVLAASAGMTLSSRRPG